VQRANIMSAIHAEVVAQRNAAVETATACLTADPPHASCETAHSVLIEGYVGHLSRRRVRRSVLRLSAKLKSSTSSPKI
jgi:hypothetical protein